METNDTTHREREIEALAEHLHEEREYRSWTWPTHPDDEGYRGGGYVTITPPDVQALLREEAGRILIRVDQLRQRAALSVSTPTGEGEELDAARFRALMHCGRIRMQGSCGVNPKTGERTYQDRPGSVHFGAEFWPQGEPEPEHSTVWGRHALRALADDILALRPDLAHPQQGGERDAFRPMAEGARQRVDALLRDRLFRWGWSLEKCLHARLVDDLVEAAFAHPVQVGERDILRWAINEMADAAFAVSPTAPSEAQMNRLHTAAEKLLDLRNYFTVPTSPSKG